MSNNAAAPSSRLSTNNLQVPAAATAAAGQVMVTPAAKLVGHQTVVPGGGGPGIASAVPSNFSGVTAAANNVIVRYPPSQSPVGVQPGQNIVVASGMSGTQPAAATGSPVVGIAPPPVTATRGPGGLVRPRGRGGPRTRGPRPDFRMRMRPPGRGGGHPGGPPGRFRPPRPGMRPRMPGPGLRPPRPDARPVRPGGPGMQRGVVRPPGGIRPRQPPQTRPAPAPAPPKPSPAVVVKIEDEDDDIIEIIEAPPPTPPKNPTLDKLRSCGISVSRQAPPKIPRINLPPGWSEGVSLTQSLNSQGIK